MGSSRPYPNPAVVVASRQSSGELALCLEAIAPQVRRFDGELIVARDSAAGPVGALVERFSPLTVVEGPAGSPVPVLRGLGLAASAGDPVALTEDHLVPAPDWLDRLIAALEPDWDVVGGGMENGTRGRLVDWAAYYADYGFYSAARPERAGVPLLTAANVAYRRRIVADVAAWARQSAWENVVHDRLAAAGRRLRFEPRARVLHRHRYSFRAFLGNRFEHGRAYAAQRMIEHPGLSRRARTLAAPVLVPILFSRIARACWREAPGAFLLAVPITVTFLGGWAMGEAAGYLRAPAPPART